MKMLLLVSLVLLLEAATGQQRSLRGSSELKRVPLVVEPEQFEATQGDESDHITAHLAAAHAQKHVIPSLAWTPIVPTDEGNKK